MNIWFYFKVFTELIHADLNIFKQSFFDKFINLSIWVVLTIVITAYILPYFGLSIDFGVFQFAGLMAATGLFSLYGNIIDLVSDFEGDRIIDYSLTLPIPSWLAIMSKAVYYFIAYFILSLLMLPVGKLSLWYQLDLTQITYGKLFLILICQSIFYAFFVLWASSIIVTMAKLGNVWMRCIFPMWFMGGFQFSWLALYIVMPKIAYVSLLNPIIYITEAMRSAMIGQSGYINFWLCLLALSIFSTLFLVIGFRNLKKRLDFV